MHIRFKSYETIKLCLFFGFWIALHPTVFGSIYAQLFPYSIFLLKFFANSIKNNVKRLDQGENCWFFGPWTKNLFLTMNYKIFNRKYKTKSSSNILQNCQWNVKCLSSTRFITIFTMVEPHLSFIVFGWKLHNQRHTDAFVTLNIDVSSKCTLVKWM